MDIKQYQLEAEATKSEGIRLRQFDMDDDYRDILHAIIGISTEAGELLDPIKKAMFYGKKIDLVNLDEEIGDILWYVAIYCNARQISIEEVATRNNAKLKTRYPDKFTEFHALNRDLDAERKILEE